MLKIIGALILFPFVLIAGSAIVSMFCALLVSVNIWVIIIALLPIIYILEK